MKDSTVPLIKPLYSAFVRETTLMSASLTLVSSDMVFMYLERC